MGIILSTDIYLAFGQFVCLFVEKQKTFVDDFYPSNPVREFHAKRLLDAIEVLILLLASIVAKNLPDEMLRLVSKDSACPIVMVSH